MYPNKLHIVSFDNPFPPNYGGVIDVFYKLKALHELGVEITFHAFEYGRKPAIELAQYCSKVYYYQRRTFANPFIGTLPYIVSTRNSEVLLENLLVDEAPILFEGLHTCYFLNHSSLANRTKWVRMHNIEHEYYQKLEEVESNFFKKYFFSKEASRLKHFEKILKHAQGILAISPNDKKTLGKHYKHVKYIPAFHANQEVTSGLGKGDYVFYHGKLSVGENDEAARYLVEKVFSQTDIPFHLAGDKASAQLKSLIADKPHIKLWEQLDTNAITQMIENAHINILPTFQNTGIKLKLINVLYQGRFVIANNIMVENTGLESLCTRANTPDEMLWAINQKMQEDFTAEIKDQRNKVLKKQFNNNANALQLAKLIFKK